MIAAIIVSVALSFALAACGVRSSGTTIERYSSIGTVVAAWIGFVGLVVLLVYTREAFLLRKTAEQQNENAVKPIVLLDLSSEDSALGGTMKLKDPALRNIGNGSAFDIAVKSLTSGEVAVEFIDMPLLEVKEHRPLKFEIVENGQKNGVSTWTVKLTSLIVGKKLPQKITASVEFASITGKRYRTLHNISYDDKAKSLRTSFQRIEEA